MWVDYYSLLFVFVFLYLLLQVWTFYTARQLGYSYGLTCTCKLVIRWLFVFIFLLFNIQDVDILHKQGVSVEQCVYVSWLVIHCWLCLYSYIYLVFKVWIIQTSRVFLKALFTCEFIVCCRLCCIFIIWYSGVDISHKQGVPVEYCVQVS